MNARPGNKWRAITLDERRHIEEGLKNKEGIKRLGAELGRHPAVLHQEIKRGRQPTGEYSAEYAEAVKLEKNKNRMRKFRKSPSKEEELLIRELYEKKASIREIREQVKWGMARLRSYLYSMGMGKPRGRPMLYSPLSEEIESLKEAVRTLTEIIKDMANGDKQSESAAIEAISAAYSKDYFKNLTEGEKALAVQVYVLYKNGQLTSAMHDLYENTRELKNEPIKAAIQGLYDTIST